ncbi:MAG: hypothetical protein ACE5HB_06670 [Terriglobia bacterium]
MEELPLAIQLKLRELSGAEAGQQVVDLVLEDGRVVPDVTVVDCTLVEETTFEAHMVADVRLPAQPPGTKRALIFIVLLLLGIFVLFWLLRGLVPQ